jgi:hypothetical protein
LAGSPREREPTFIAILNWSHGAPIEHALKHETQEVLLLGNEAPSARIWRPLGERQVAVATAARHLRLQEAQMSDIDF